MRMFSGRPEELKLVANFLTDAIELRSNSRALIFAHGFSLAIFPWTSLPASMFLTPITTLTPRNARTLAVSKPIPLDAPAPILLARTYKCIYTNMLCIYIYTYFKLVSWSVKYEEE